MNGMKKCITAANHNKGWQLSLLLRDYFNKQWNTIIRSEKKKDFVYMSVGNYILFSRTEMFNVMVYICLHFLHLKTFLNI